MNKLVVVAPEHVAGDTHTHRERGGTKVRGSGGYWTASDPRRMDEDVPDTSPLRRMVDVADDPSALRRRVDVADTHLPDATDGGGDDEQLSLLDVPDHRLAAAVLAHIMGIVP